MGTQDLRPFPVGHLPARRGWGCLEGRQTGTERDTKTPRGDGIKQPWMRPRKATRGAGAKGSEGDGITEVLPRGAVPGAGLDSAMQKA